MCSRFLLYAQDIATRNEMLTKIANLPDKDKVTVAEIQAAVREILDEIQKHIGGE